MKRLFSFLLVSLLLVASLTCFAYAADRYTGEWTTVSDDTGASLTYNSSTGVYTASYTSTHLKEGSEYILLVVRGTSATEYDSLSAVTIKYINQTGYQSDSVSFDFIPMSTPSCVVLLCGEFDGASSPVFLGTLVKKGIPVSGTVTSYGSSAPSVTIYDESGMSIETVSATGGSYTFSAISAGDTYYIKAAKAGHVGSPIEITIGEDDSSFVVPAIKLYGGDVDISGTINVYDLSYFLGDYGKNSSEVVLNHADSDIDKSGTVNVFDLSYLLAGYGHNDVSVADFIAG